MKRLFFLSMPAMMLTVLLVSKPQPNAGGQPHGQDPAPQDTTRRKPILQDSIELARELDSNRAILNEIQGNVQGIKQGVNQLVKDRKVAERRADKLSKAGTDTVIDTVRVAYPVKVPVPVEVIDSAMQGRTWWGQMFQHVKRCRVGLIFKPRQWGKGKF